MAPFNLLLVRQSMLIRQQDRERFHPQGMKFQRGTFAARRGQCDVEFPVVQSPDEVLSSVLKNFQTHFRVMLVKLSDKFRQNVWRNGGNGADGQLADNLTV